VSVRLGVVNLAGPEWASSAGGRIDRYIVLDLRLARAEEGGPVLDAAGGRLGITTFGPRAKVLVIPAATIERIVPALLRTGTSRAAGSESRCSPSRCRMRCTARRASRAA